MALRAEQFPREHRWTPEAVATEPSRLRDPRYQSYLILRVLFTVAPIAAGLDKFFHILVNWDRYLAPRVADALPFSAHTFMLIVGGVEIAAGLLVALWPRFAAYVVSAWLLGIIVNLLLIPGYYDVALRDFGLAVGAFALGRQAQGWHRAAA